MALRELRIAPLQQRLLINHWIACFLKYPSYWGNGKLVLTAFRLPANLLKDLPGHFLPRDERFNHTERDALVVPSALMGIDYEVDGQRQTLAVVVDATGFPDAEDARRLFRSPVAAKLRADWRRENGVLLSLKRGRPSARRRATV